MHFSVFLSENILKHCQNVQPFKTAVLIGTIDIDSCKISIHTLLPYGEDNIEQLETFLPSDYKVIGFWTDTDVSEDFGNSLLQQVTDQNSSTVFGQRYLLRWRCSFDDLRKKNLNPSQFDLSRLDGEDETQFRVIVNCISADELCSKTLSIKLNYSASLVLQLTDNMDQRELEDVVLNAFEALLCRHSSYSDVGEDSAKNCDYSFKAKAGNLLLSEIGCVYPPSLNAKSTCYDLWRFLQQSDEGKVKRKELHFSQDFVDFVMLRHITGNCDAKSEQNYVPVVYYEMNNFNVVTIPLELNVIYVCSQSTPLSRIVPALKLALQRQLESAKECFLTFSNFKVRRFVIPQPFVFMPPYFSHFILVHYPKRFTNEELEPNRRNLCEKWKLSINKPTIRRENRFLFSDQQGFYLWNVHKHVGFSGLSSGQIGVVQGNYQYYHYMQNNFDDKGWGCAYRSFQTVWSWLFLQGYTEKPVPTHREIQQALVEIGDRPATFVGTKQWIGSMELSFCLNHMLGISSKILSVSSGSEMLSKARELISHFETEGSPVMIGGGVLAHTILGVQFDEDIGEAKFLILDPHYTGDENIKTIVEKGWCGWKPISFWDATAFYNMLLPQRPTMF